MQINDLKQQLENEINKNKALTIQIQEFDAAYKNILKENQDLMDTNKRLKIELSSIKNIKGNNNINSEEIISLYKKLEELKEKLARYPFELLKDEKLISVIFSVEQNNYSIICKNTETLSRLVEKLYKDHPEYSENENYFISNGGKVDIFKTLDKNNIHDGDIIILNKIEI